MAIAMNAVLNEFYRVAFRTVAPVMPRLTISVLIRNPCNNDLALIAASDLPRCHSR
jgi:hypothetical protein